ncbi:PIG-L deacetylase family protein [Paenibacillus cremeus]|uniref:PIG-L family deacetylase n=1 Tax=Paenibacillus cremeus TaxID=2163881 RepID=A0A559K6I3_9BACL|nr:PIG-L family deacetylase [Paenibacillus cremeus]TVY07734.1 PIG-L family deacetylase [Paenibacillus cremeus]
MANVSFIYAHPDDETFLSAGFIRQLADAGHPPSMLLSTRGDAGNKNGDYIHWSREQLGELREREMSRAAEILGLAEVEYLGLPDGKTAEADESTFLEGVIRFINHHRPRTLVTFPLDGGNRHPDHMAISRMTTKAVLSGRCPSVEQLYYIMSAALAEEGRKPTFQLDVERQWSMKADALRAHDSQKLAIGRYFGPLDTFPENRRYESFILAWELGEIWPEKDAEQALRELDLLQEN